MIITLIGALSDNHLKLIQNNTVFPTQEKVDLVGFEPTTSASFFACEFFCFIFCEDMNLASLSIVKVHIAD